MDNINRPILLYDNRCKLCTSFAKNIRRLSRGKIIIIGHYSKEGDIFNNMIPNARSMFWIIINNNAYGGRSGLIPLLKEIIKSIFDKSYKFDKEIVNECNDDCSLARILSLLINGRRIKL